MEIQELEGMTVKIRWLQPITLDVCDHLDRHGEGVFERETFEKDEVVEVDVFGVDELNNRIDIQFGDGSVATAVSTSLFAVEEVS
jgi:hypothetical protein